MAFTVTLGGCAKPRVGLSGWVLWAVAEAAWAVGAAAPFLPPPLPSRPTEMAAPPELKASEAAPTPLAEVPSRLSGMKLGSPSAALIDDQWLTVGKTTRGARLLSVSPKGAVLQRRNGRRDILALHPDVQWVPITKVAE